ncbi:hypothetical protein BD626DRAFT_507033, partial [Schizophyllum amplum]
MHPAVSTSTATPSMEHAWTSATTYIRLTLNTPAGRRAPLASTRTYTMHVGYGRTCRRPSTSSYLQSVPHQTRRPKTSSR